MTTELWRWSATDLAKAIRQREISSQEVIQAHLERIAAVNDKVKAITRLLPDQARRMAEAADKAVAAGEELGPLHGVPVTVKENIDLTGSATTQGVSALKEVLPPVDAPHITRLKKAGAIPIGRTNLPDFGLRWHTSSSLHGATLNPWDSALSPGGSSGGEAAALATGMTPLGIGNDYGGSLRIPSRCCGTAAIRPTLGRVPSASSVDPGEMPITIQLFAVQGPMARHIRDLRTAFEVMIGPDARDPWFMPIPLPGPKVAGPIKVAVVTQPGSGAVDPAVTAAVEQAAQALAEAGYVLEAVEPPLIDAAAEMWARLVITEVYEFFMPQIRPIVSPDGLKFLDMVKESYAPLDFRGYIHTLAERNRISREWSLFQTQYPLILGPVTTEQPFKANDDLASKERVKEIVESHRFITPCNLLGLPAAVVPVEISGGLPQSVQIIGARYREDLCLDAAEVIEQKFSVLTPIDPK